jgi:hypothetical protein
MRCVKLQEPKYQLYRFYGLGSKLWVKDDEVLQNSSKLFFDLELIKNTAKPNIHPLPNVEPKLFELRKLEQKKHHFSVVKRTKLSPKNYA